MAAENAKGAEGLDKINESHRKELAVCHSEEA